MDRWRSPRRVAASSCGLPEGGGRLVVELTPAEAGELANALNEVVS